MTEINKYFIDVNRTLTTYIIDKGNVSGGVTYERTYSTPAREVINDLRGSYSSL